ncbi:hypothetical protein GF412_00890 [Candidatus Micrarchaeota archaeon]|nr:hypothetical protein [Candidatus Micrarchaeota archaeon]MBD3417529.1 hypothetical protein [Candidatus Micrarchaeota archaeon]
MAQLTAKNLMYASIGLAFLGAVMAISSSASGWLGLIGGLLAGLGGLGGVVFFKYGYIVVPLLTERQKIVMITDTGYEIPPSQDVIVKKVGNEYYASAFLAIRIYESATERTPDQNVAYNKYFERAISNMRYAVKICYLLYAEDVAEKRRMIETRKAEAQLRLARERDKAEPDVLKMDKYEREIGMWDTQLQRLIKGVRPMGVLAYAMTSASGISKESAVATLRAQVREVKVTLQNALNVQVEQLTADEMKRCFEWEYAFPSGPKAIEESIL